MKDMADENVSGAEAAGGGIGPACDVNNAPEPRSFRELLREAQAGSEVAARELYETYVAHVLRCVRNRMWHKLRPKFDSQDFVQQVFASFFVGQAKLPDFETPEDLIAFLMRLATNKVVMEGRRGRGSKRDAKREEPIDTMSHSVGHHPPTRLPTPSTVAVFRERYESLVDRQQPETREIAELRYEGHTFEEISEELEIDESNARKAMRRLKRRTEDVEEEQGE